VIDVYASTRRDTEAATSFLTRAVETMGVRPHTATTDKAAIYTTRA
jgi:transposase-like protein